MNHVTFDCPHRFPFLEHGAIGRCLRCGIAPMDVITALTAERQVLIDEGGRKRKGKKAARWAAVVAAIQRGEVAFAALRPEEMTTIIEEG